MRAILLVFLIYSLRMKTVQTQKKKLEKQVSERTQALERKTGELEHKTGELEKINTIVKSINAGVEPIEILHTLLDESTILEGFDQAFALVYDKSLEAYQTTRKAGNS